MAALWRGCPARRVMGYQLGRAVWLKGVCMCDMTEIEAVWAQLDDEERHQLFLLVLSRVGNTCASQRLISSEIDLPSVVHLE